MSVKGVLAEYLERDGITLEELADRSSISRAVLRKIASGATALPRSNTWEALQTGMNLGPEDPLKSKFDEAMTLAAERRGQERIGILAGIPKGLTQVEKRLYEGIDPDNPDTLDVLKPPQLFRYVRNKVRKMTTEQLARQIDPELDQAGIERLARRIISFEKGRKVRAPNPDKIVGALGYQEGDPLFDRLTKAIAIQDEAYKKTKTRIAGKGIAKGSLAATAAAHTARIQGLDLQDPSTFDGRSVSDVVLAIMYGDPQLTKAGVAAKLAEYSVPLTTFEKLLRGDTELPHYHRILAEALLLDKTDPRLVILNDAIKRAKETRSKQLSALTKGRTRRGRRTR